jgi:hypothetical protein
MFQIIYKFQRLKRVEEFQKRIGGLLPREVGKRVRVRTYKPG